MKPVCEERFGHQFSIALARHHTDRRKRIARIARPPEARGSGLTEKYGGFWQLKSNPLASHRGLGDSGRQSRWIPLLADDGTRLSARRSPSMQTSVCFDDQPTSLSSSSSGQHFGRSLIQPPCIVRQVYVAKQTLKVVHESRRDSRSCRLASLESEPAIPASQSRAGYRDGKNATGSYGH